MYIYVEILHGVFVRVHAFMSGDVYMKINLHKPQVFKNLRQM